MDNNLNPLNTLAGIFSKTLGIRRISRQMQNMILILFALAIILIALFFSAILATIVFVRLF